MTTFGLPAECGRFIQYETSDDLRQLDRDGVLKDALQIGGGSNLLYHRAVRWYGTPLRKPELPHIATGRKRESAIGSIGWMHS